MSNPASVAGSLYSLKKIPMLCLFLNRLIKDFSSINLRVLLFMMYQDAVNDYAEKRPSGNKSFCSHYSVWMICSRQSFGQEMIIQDRIIP